MHDFGGRVKRVTTVDEFRETLTAADTNRQLVVVLACAGWHHGSRLAARALTEMSLEYSPDSCVFVMCDLATGSVVAQHLQIVVIPTFKLFQNQVQLESHASFSRMRTQLEFHGARREESSTPSQEQNASIELSETPDEERAALVRGPSDRSTLSEADAQAPQIIVQSPVDVQTAQSAPHMAPSIARVEERQQLMRSI